MIARAFRPVAWVGAIAVAALCCYMLSLKVARERADLATLEGRILSARQDIRTLQTELGTRGRLQQLEQWNADVLALAAPVAGQFVARDVSLARFDVRAQGFQPNQEVQLAAAQPAPAAPPMTVAPRQASLAQAPGVETVHAVDPVVRRASLTTEPAPAPTRNAAPRVVRAEPEHATPRPAQTESGGRRSPSLLDEGTLHDLGRTARAERRAARD